MASNVLRELLVAAVGVGSVEAASEVLDYVNGMIDDEDFEYGKDGEDAWEAIGTFLVSDAMPHNSARTVYSPTIPPYAY